MALLEELQDLHDNLRDLLPDTATFSSADYCVFLTQKMNTVMTYDRAMPTYFDVVFSRRNFSGISEPAPGNTFTVDGTTYLIIGNKKHPESNRCHCLPLPISMTYKALTIVDGDPVRTVKGQFEVEEPGEGINGHVFVSKDDPADEDSIFQQERIYIIPVPTSRAPEPRARILHDSLEARVNSAEEIRSIEGDLIAYRMAVI